jgi:hypothetical protein
MSGMLPKKAKTSVAVSAGLRALCDAQSTSSPAVAVRGLCTELLHLSGVLTAPIPLRPLLEKLSIVFQTVAAFRPGRGAASLTSTSRGMAIWVHDPEFRRNYRRTRFSIAHEIVHALVIKILANDRLVSSLDSTPEAHEELERLCDLGAAHLLMPSWLVREHLRTRGLSPAALLQLYDQFLVSRDVLLWGIASALPRGSAIRWRTLARNASEKSTWRVVRSYPRYGMDPHRPWLPNGATAKHLSDDLPSKVASSRSTVACDSLTVTLGRRNWMTAAYGTFIASRPRDRSRPLFAGFEVADERNHGGEVLVFLTERGTTAWHGARSEEDLHA